MPPRSNWSNGILISREKGYEGVVLFCRQLATGQRPGRGDLNDTGPGNFFGKPHEPN